MIWDSITRRKREREKERIIIIIIQSVITLVSAGLSTVLPPTATFFNLFRAVCTALLYEE